MCKKSLLMMLLLALLVPWAANAQKALPYSYGFENNDLDAEGWTVQKTNSSTGISTSAKHEGSYGFQFNYSERNAYLVSPVLSGTESGVALSFYYKESSSTYGDEQFYVGYTTDETVTDPSAFTYGNITTASLAWQLYETMLPAGTKKVAIKYVYNDALYLYLDDFTFEAPSACPKPSGLNFTLTPGDGTVATLSWTSDADAWQICLNGDETNLIPATTNPYTLTGLTPETTYTAKVRTNCGSEQSGWSNEVTFTPTNAYQLTVNDGTSTNSYVPYYAYYHDASQRSEFIIPASSLSDLAWGTITSMKFYPNYTFTTNASIKVYLMEVEEETFSDVTFYGETDATVVYDGTLSISPNGMTIAFAGNGFHYGGGNLLVGFYQSAGGSGYYSSSTCPFYGVSATGASISQYSSYSDLRNFLPKTTFDYIPGEAPDCMWPTNLAVSNVTARTAELSWTSDGAAWEVEVVGEYTTTWNADAIPFTLQGLEPETEYTVRVRTVCGTDVYSDWSTPVSFTTEPLCHTPLNLYADEITAYTAHLSWEGVETTYDLRYAVLPTTRNTTKTVKLTDIINLSSADYNANQQVSAAPNAQPNGTSGEQLRDGWDGWYYYDNGTYYTNIGYGSESTFYWATLFPANSWTDNILTKVALYENSYNENPITLYVCTGTTAPEDVLYYEEFDPEGNAGFHELTLATPVVIDPTQNLWIVFAEVGTYPACAASNTTGTTNATWYSGDGSNWYSASDYTWMVRAYVETIDIDNLTWVEVPSLEAFEYDMTDLTPETHYIAQVRANCGTENGVSNWITTTFTTDPTCLIPTNLAVVGNPTAHTVTLNWTENGDATTWDVEVVGSYTTTWTATEYPYTVVGLEPDTEYSFRVRARCSDTDFSEWSTHVTAVTDIACYAPTSLAVANITGFTANLSWVSDANSCDLRYAPNIENEGDSWLVYDDGVYATNIGSSAASTRTWAVMYPASMLDGNTMLSMLSIYENSNIESNITINIYQGGETAPETLLYTEVVVPMNAGFHNVPLTEPVTIDPTQNLWIALTATGPYVMPACAVNDANNRWICTDGVWQELTSELSDYGWMIRAYVGGALDWVNVTGLTEYQYALANLEPETEYIVQVRSNCEEEGYSWWTEANFTTDVACPAPTALAATPYANSAVLSWEGISESYTVSYRTAAYVDGDTEEFATTSAPTGWTRYSTLLTDDVLNGTTALSVSTYGWYFGNYNGVFDNHARLNIYGTTCNYWLVTPAMEVSEGSEFGFDLALTAYSGSNVPAPATTGTDDRFVVLVSTDEMATWTILRQWDNAGSEYVYNNIANTATGENVSFDFSAYAGQTVYVAFYGESTASNADNNLHIDNVALGTLVPAGEWMTVTTEEAAATITGLTAETKYEWKVQGDCGDFGMSEESAIMSFTTTNDACPVPTSLTVNNETITARTADLSWEGSPDVESFTVRYRAPEHIVGGISESFNSNSVPAGWTKYSGLVNDVIAGTATLTTTTSGWYTTEYALGTYNMKVNIYGTSAKYWLVTPEVTLSSGNFSFDLALTDYNNSDPIEDATAQADDRFVVLVYANDAWTILREWNNTGSDYVYNTIATEGEAVSIDLSAYVGQTVKIAFYGESTASGGDNDLHIDNVVIGNPQTIPATDWMTVENITDMNVTLTGLTPETPYEAQVKADCSDPEAWSNTVTFTTLEQTTLTQTIELAAGSNYVSFYVETTLADLKAALAGAAPTANISIKSQTQTTTYNPNNHRWTGNITLDLAQMYIITVSTEFEISLEGMPLNPADLSVTITGNGTAYIGFPFSTSMTLTDAFAGLAVQGDKVKSQNATCAFNRGRWGNQIPALEPGKGYKYISNDPNDRVLVYPINAKAE